MRLSVIIPYYNSDAWIGKTLDTLLDQDLDSQDYEIIIVDDASTEETPVLNSYLNLYPNVRCYRRHNSGLSESRNFGVSVSEGDWIFFCDSDDFVQPQVFGGLLTIAERLRLDILFANSVRLREGAVVNESLRNFSAVSPIRTGLDFYAEPPKTFAYGVWRLLINRAFWIFSNLHFEDVCFVEDRLFYQDMLPCVNRAAHVDVDLYYYVQRDSSMVHRKKRENSSEYMSYMFRYIERLLKDIRSCAFPHNVTNKMKEYLAESSYILLHNLFRYCPVKETGEYICRLKEHGVYPIDGKGGIVRAMNVKWFWLLCCRVYHLIPASLRVRF